MKQCKQCKQEKPFSEFYEAGKYYQAKCKPCLIKHATKLQTERKYTTGIYGIFFNNNCLWVGRTKKYEKRIAQHKFWNNTNHYEFYQEWPDNDNLEFKILEKCSYNELRIKEKYWIIKLKPKYNNGDSKHYKYFLSISELKNQQPYLKPREISTKLGIPIKAVYHYNHVKVF